MTHPIDERKERLYTAQSIAMNAFAEWREHLGISASRATPGDMAVLEEMSQWLIRYSDETAPRIGRASVERALGDQDAPNLSTVLNRAGPPLDASTKKDAA